MNRFEEKIGRNIMSDKALETQSKSSNDNNAEGSQSFKVRCLVQQCYNAKLQIKLADKQNNIEPEWVQVVGDHLILSLKLYLFIILKFNLKKDKQWSRIICVLYERCFQFGCRKIR